jgi:hypothetical protein
MIRDSAAWVWSAPMSPKDDAQPLDPKRRFRFGVFAACFLIALAYPLSVIVNLKSGYWTWLQNEPAFSIFMPLLFPLAVAVFFTACDISPLWRATRLTRVFLLSALGVFIIFVIISAVSDSRRPLPLAPYMVKDSTAASALEVRLRKQLYDPHNRDFRTQEKGLKLAREERQSYVEAFPTFKSFSDQIARGSSTSWITLALNILAFSFVAFYLWYLGMLVLLQSPSPRAVNDLVLVYALLVLWLPIRLYSEWYANFYVVDLSTFGAYAVSILAAVIALILLVGVIKPNAATKIFSISSTIVVAVTGAIGKVKPEWLWDIANTIEHIQPVLFLFGTLILLFVVLIFVARVMQGGFDASAALMQIGKKQNDGGGGSQTKPDANGS